MTDEASGSGRDADPPGSTGRTSSGRPSPLLRMLPALGLSWVAVGIIGTGLLYFMLGSPADDEALDARGTPVLATPLRYTLSSTSQSGAVSRYTVELAFIDATGKKQTTSLETNHQDQFEAAKAGTPIEIEYDPEKPERARWTGTRINPLGNLIYWLGGIVVTMGLGVAVFGLILRGSKRRA